MTNLDSILKSRAITLPRMVHLVKAMVFPVVMYGCESWTLKKAEWWRIGAFELWCWRRLLRVPWTARRSNRSVLNEISPEYSLEGLMLKLKLQYFVHLMWRTDSLEKTLMLRKTEGGRRKGQQRMRWLDGITNSMDMSVSSQSWWWTGGLLAAVQAVAESDMTERPTDWTNLNCSSVLSFLRNLHPVSILAAPTYAPTSSHEYSLSSTSLPALVISCLFDNSPSNRCEMVSHCSFLPFPD